MGLLDKFFKKQNNELRKVIQASAFQAIKRGNFVGGRETSDKMHSYSFWYEGVIARDQLRSRDIIEKLKVVRDVNPDASMALWNILRLANKGHSLEAVTVGGKVEKATTDRLNELASKVGVLYGGGTDQLISVLLLTAITQGAIALEVELNEDITDVVEFHAIDPFSLDYRKDRDTGELQLVQKQSNGDYKILNQEQVFYFPIDPDIGDPYGRIPILPVLQVVFFQAEVLRDLRKAVHHFGYERFDISVVEEAIMNNMPEHIKSAGNDAVSEYVSSYINDVQNQMMELEPDDDFFHTDSVKIETMGVTGSRSLDAKAVIDVINQQMVTSLKQLPILLGRNEGTTETHGTIQWQIYVSGIQSIQRAIRRILEKGFNVALQVYGKQLKARLEFEALQVNDRKAEAEAEEIETRVKIQQVDQGWIDNDEASNDMVGHDSVADPKPKIAAPVAVQANPIVPQTDNPLPANNAPADVQTGAIQRFVKLDAQKKTRDLDFTVDIPEKWSKKLEKVLEKSHKKYKRFLNDQRKMYVERLKNAEAIPTRILADIAGLRKIEDGIRKEPTPEFKDWITINVLYDSYGQMEKLDELVSSTVQEAVEVVGVSVLDEIKPEMLFDSKDTTLLQWISDRSKRASELIQGVSDESVLSTLWDEVNAGHYTIPSMSEALQNAYGFSESRANTIARTEVITAGRAGQFFGDTQSGIVIGKKWKAANQSRTRDSHRNANNQVVALNEPFIVNGEQLMFPGDGSLNASAENLINCRCWYMRILEGEEDLMKG